MKLKSNELEAAWRMVAAQISGQSERFQKATHCPFLRVPEAVYNHVREVADTRSLDMSKLLLFSALGEIRLPSQSQFAVGVQRKKVLRMSLTDGQSEVDAIITNATAAVHSLPWEYLRVEERRRDGTSELTLFQ